MERLSNSFGFRKRTFYNPATTEAQNRTSSIGISQRPNILGARGTPLFSTYAIPFSQQHHQTVDRLNLQIALIASNEEAFVEAANDIILPERDHIPQIALPENEAIAERDMFINVDGDLAELRRIIEQQAAQIADLEQRLRRTKQLSRSRGETIESALASIESLTQYARSRNALRIGQRIEVPPPRQPENVGSGLPSCRNYDQRLAPDLALSKQICDSFDRNGLKEVEEEVTEIEEFVFQRVLRTKMVCDLCSTRVILRIYSSNRKCFRCDLCSTRVKQFRCYKCLYSICQNCSDEISKERSGYVNCPHCREPQTAFVQLKLPRF